MNGAGAGNIQTTAGAGRSRRPSLSLDLLRDRIILLRDGTVGRIVDRPTIDRVRDRGLVAVETASTAFE